MKIIFFSDFVMHSLNLQVLKQIREGEIVNERTEELTYETVEDTEELTEELTDELTYETLEDTAGTCEETTNECETLNQQTSIQQTEGNEAAQVML